ncbi:MAG: ImmA/IrrE family metallo-endopeptidase [Spirochaetales bacterium]|nr:ImmA/IrrE family metallo-endopeptidase [Spirochaetales bacterium]
MIETTSRIPIGYKVRRRFPSEIEEIVSNVRQIFGISNGYFPIIKVFEILQDLGKIDLRILPDSSLSSLGETTLAKHGQLYIACIKLKNSVYEGACEGNGFHRFTCCHELGHAIMHLSEMKLERSTSHRENRNWLVDSEWQANQFASKLLMPKSMIFEDHSAKDIVNMFGVSYKAANIRIKDITKHGGLKKRQNPHGGFDVF